MQGPSRSALIKAMNAILSEPWSDKRALADVASVAKEFYRVLALRCKGLGIETCEDCGLFTAPAEIHYCPDFDRERTHKLATTKPPKHS